MIFHDELEEIQLGLSTRIYTLDLADLRAPRVVRATRARPATTDHNGYTRGNHYYVSHYRRGVVVFDATNPEALTEVAHFDNYLVPSTNDRGHERHMGRLSVPAVGQSARQRHRERPVRAARSDAQTLNQNAGGIGFAELSLGSGTEGAPGRSNPACSERSAGAPEPSACSTRRPPARRPKAPTTPPTSGTLSWGGAGDLADKVIAILVADDTSVEAAETLTVTLSALTGGATLDGSSTLTVTINDNDTSPPPSGGGGGGGGGSSDLVLLALLAGVLLARCARAPAPIGARARPRPATAPAPRSSGCAGRAADTARACRAA